jgi:hypothetical protein
MATSRPTAPQSLQFRTLSGVFESARIVCRLLKIEHISTTTLLKQRLTNINRSPDELMELLQALDALYAASATLGNTALIHPSEHPLIVRQTAPMPKGK